MKIPIVVFMSEIKFNLTLKKKNQIFCFFYAFICNNYVLPTRQPSRQKTYFFPSNFASISSCSACLVGIVWGKNTVSD